MKLSSWAWAWALTGCLFMGDAMAQGLRQPFSVQPAGFDYNRYLQDDAPSPSDAPAAPADDVDSKAAPVVDASDCCDTGCGNYCDSGCDSCCSSSCCGCGLGSLFDCCLGDEFKVGSMLFDDCSQWSIGGWTQLGYHDESNGLFNSHPGKLNLHQQWLYLERTARPTCCSIDWGFRADLMYGVDGADTQAFGNTVDGNGDPRGWDTGWNHEIYGWALRQLKLDAPDIQICASKAMQEDWISNHGWFVNGQGTTMIKIPEGELAPADDVEPQEVGMLA